ncbi:MULTISPECIES: hypothetical protein [Rhizobium]|uniref:Uncharacterized protein n=1 Tax=Rhizobium favelukesii TaxID=348824 RepID=W6RK33_9HYPH|nr:MULTISPECIES: hypothetical protein [Rhizobium]MCA0803272.1 hypothetical protein [Rhizobium sp. T1473]MCS0460528.1 hypothetical protein [Rhizobium favelukesii]UFS83125.1 hypothetical protein LPB79_12800 [Rhizobium sp. T136]CDM59248.1 hypothetical protein LPU83_3605 [Rhizobium favelukesii]
MTSKDELFNPAKLSPRDKATVTDTTARAIVTAEAAAREKKTEKLRALRLQQEADAPPAAAPVKKRRTARKSASSS